MVAVMVAASGIRKVRSFLLSESVDEDGDHYVRRRKRKGEHASTLMPPGSPAPAVIRSTTPRLTMPDMPLSM